MTTYLPVPPHLAYVAWLRVEQAQLAQLATAPQHARIEAARRMAHRADAEAVVTLIADVVPVGAGDHTGEVLRVRLATFEQRHGSGLLVPGLQGSGRAGSRVFAVGAGPSIERARGDLFERVAAVLRPEGADPTTVIDIPRGS